jgi:glycosyltransferase involved in cell wall biosynthesis
MKISVIIPIYNGERWAAQCIENVLWQTYKDLEVIVVDDGSTDRTAEIAGRYPVRLLRQENRGLAASRNRGIEEATGDYIHFMDVDDWINVDFYERMADAAQVTGADMAFSGMIHGIRPHQSRLWDERWLVVDPHDKYELTNTAVDGYAWRYILRRSMLLDSGLRFEDGRLIEDLPFTVQAVWMVNRIVTVPGAVYYYKKREGSRMQDTDPEKKRKRLADLTHARSRRGELISDYGLDEEVYGLKTLHKYEYKVLGIPVVTRVHYNNGKTRWYLFGGLYVMQFKRLTR